MWRTPNEFWNKIIGPLVLGSIMGTLFLQMDNNQAGATQRSAVIFFSMLICDLLAMRTHPDRTQHDTHGTTHADISLLNRTAAIPKILAERAVFYREHAARTYNSLVYAASIILPELPFAVITAVLYTYVTFHIPFTTFFANIFLCVVFKIYMLQ